MKHIDIPTLWSDQDGVIAQYEMHAWRQSDSNPHPIGFQSGVHYFQHVKPNEKIIQSYEQLNQKLEFHVLTNILRDPNLQQEHTSDKWLWTKHNMPYLRHTEQYHIIQIPKWNYAENLLHRKLRPTDILVSDYNEDLVPWSNAGGTAVKYLNGINSRESYHGPCIHPEWDINQIVTFLMDLTIHQ